MLLWNSEHLQIELYTFKQMHLQKIQNQIQQCISSWQAQLHMQNPQNTSVLRHQFIAWVWGYFCPYNQMSFGFWMIQSRSSSILTNAPVSVNTEISSKVLQATLVIIRRIEREFRQYGDAISNIWYVGDITIHYFSRYFYVIENSPFLKVLMFLDAFFWSRNDPDLSDQLGSNLSRGSVACCCHCWRSLVPVSSMSQTTQIELEPKDYIFLGKSLYIQFIPQLFSTVSIPNKLRQTSAPNSHKYTQSPD